ncbi:MAG: hypothetical protein SWY16_24350 [Cyanobacteriota bacterium]|nr:hypothetical protein [Cyanobacteriota bacterium]
MSEADIPTPPSQAERWEAIQFPDAIAPEELEGASIENQDLLPDRSLNSDPQNLPQNLTEAISLIEKLRQDKRQLQERVWDLEALANRIENGREPIKSASRATLETSKSDSEPEGSSVETMRAKLEACQTRMARMEREFAFAQQRYNEQAHKLKLSQRDCQELRSRLSRQQRNTLQFKAALEKCLEEVRDRECSDSDVEPSTMQVFLAKAQPVEPWSAGEVEVSAVDVSTTETVEVDLTSKTPTSSERTELHDVSQDEYQSQNAAQEQAVDTGIHPGKETNGGNTIDGEESGQSLPKASTNGQSSILPPVLTTPKRQSLSELDLPKFPPLKK